MNDSSKILYKRSDYRDFEEFLDVITRQIKLLIETKQVFSFHENPMNTGEYVLQFGSSKVSETTSFPVWLNAQEMLDLSEVARQRDYDNAKQIIKEFEEDDDDFWNEGNKGNGGNPQA